MKFLTVQQLEMHRHRRKIILKLHHHHHHHQWHCSPESGLGLPNGFRDRFITMWVISHTINLF
jgi:hypothetical protein